MSVNNWLYRYCQCQRVRERSRLLLDEERSGDREETSLIRIYAPIQKHKLPSINNRNIEAVQGVYKRPRRGTQGGGKKELLEESTKDQSVSFSVENRPMKMHSFQEKHLRVEFNSDRNNIPLIDVQIPELETANLRRLGSVSSQFRKRQL